MKTPKAFNPFVVIPLLAMSVVMTSGIVQAGEGPEGLVGIPWGASLEVVDKAMADRNYPKDSDWKVDNYIYDGYFAGYPAYLQFRFVNNKFVHGSAVLIEVFHSINDGGKHYDYLADQYFSILEGQLIQKYGEPVSRYKALGKEPWDPYIYTWKVKYHVPDASIDGEKIIEIRLSRFHAYKSGNFDQYSRVAINYHNISLEEDEKKSSANQDL